MTIVTCPHCDTKFDNARIASDCPHYLISSSEVADRKALALDLLGKDIVFRWAPEGPIYHVASITWAGFVLIDGLDRKFSPAEFIVVSKETV